MRNAGRLTTILLLCVLRAGIACAQDTATAFSRKYEESLLDSLIRYEMLKPIAYNLQKENVQIQNEKYAVQMQLQIMSFRCEQQSESFAQQIKAERRRTRKRIIVAAGTALLTGLAL